MNNNKNTNKINANNNSTKLKLGILVVSVITILMISPLSVIQYAYATDAPIIISLVAADNTSSPSPGYSSGDTITIIFDSDTDMAKNTLGVDIPKSRSMACSHLQTLLVQRTEDNGLQ